jgi:hypothetical protein
VKIERDDGTSSVIQTRCRIDTNLEMTYFRRRHPGLCHEKICRLPTMLPVGVKVWSGRTSGPILIFASLLGGLSCEC